MTILADENIAELLVARLQAAGHRVLRVADISPGIEDRDVLSTAVAQDCVLLTSDKGFGELVYRQRNVSRGVILLRLAGLAHADRAERVVRALAEHGPVMVGAFSVIGKSETRVRRS